MKKFGTPIGAAPGSAKLNDGLDGVGTPPPERGGCGFLGEVEVEPFFFAELLEDPDFFWEEDFFF